MQSKSDRNRSSKLASLRNVGLVLSLSAGIFLALPALAEQPLPNVANLSTSQRAELSKLLKAELDKTIANQNRLPGQVASPVDVRFDSKTGMILIELGRDFIPKGDTYISGALEQQLHQITGVATEILTGNLSFTGTSCTFGGIATDKLFPTEKWEPNNKKQTMSPTAEAEAPVVVSAGHGRTKDGLINATGKRSNRIRRAEGAQIADFLPVSAVCGVLPGLQAQLPRSRH